MIQEILNKLNCSVFTYNQKNNTIEKKYNRNSSIYGVRELVDIIDKLNENNINFSIDENENIKIETK